MLAADLSLKLNKWFVPRVSLLAPVLPRRPVDTFIYIFTQCTALTGWQMTFISWHKSRHFNQVLFKTTSSWLLCVFNCVTWASRMVSLWSRAALLHFHGKQSLKKILSRTCTASKELFIQCTPTCECKRWGRLGKAGAWVSVNSDVIIMRMQPPSVFIYVMTSQHINKTKQVFRGLICHQSCTAPEEAVSLA